MKEKIRASRKEKFKNISIIKSPTTRGGMAYRKKGNPSRDAAKIPRRIPN